MSKLHDRIKTLSEPVLGPEEATAHQISLVGYCYSTTTTNDLQVNMASEHLVSLSVAEYSF